MTNQLGGAGIEQHTLFCACIYTCRMYLSHTWDWGASSVWLDKYDELEASCRYYNVGWGSDIWYCRCTKTVKSELNLFWGFKCVVNWHGRWNVYQIHSLTISFIKSSRVNRSTLSLLHSKPIFCCLLINTSWQPIGLTLADVVWRATMHSGVSSG